MEADKLTYTVTSLAPKNVDIAVAKLKEQFHNMFDSGELQERQIVTKNHAHITLKRNSVLREGVTEADLLEAFSLLQCNQFEVTAQKIEVFHTNNHGNVLVILVDHSEELHLLHKKILQVFEPYAENANPFDGKSFVPHISVLYNVPESEINSAVSEIKATLLPITFTVTNALFLKEVKNKKGVRQILKELRF
jgi:2'-5' RNA ligase